MKHLVYAAVFLIGCGTNGSSASADPPSEAPASDVKGGEDAGKSSLEPDGTDGGSNDASVNLDPAKACEQKLDPRSLCRYQIGENPPATGGPQPPDGIYDRVAIVTTIQGLDPMCGSEELQLDRGTFVHYHHGVGGPYISGGRFALNTSSEKLEFDVECGDGSFAVGAVSYSWDADTGKLMIVYRSTAWIYKLR